MNRRDQSGSASLTVIALSAVVIMLGLAAAYLAAAASAHRQAQGAADLAALAGASELQHSGDGCSVARQIAADNRAHLVQCQVVGKDVLVVVEVESPVWSGHTFEITGRARAGPEH